MGEATQNPFEEDGIVSYDYGEAFVRRASDLNGSDDSKVLREVGHPRNPWRVSEVAGIVIGGLLLALNVILIGSYFAWVGGW